MMQIKEDREVLDMFIGFYNYTVILTYIGMIFGVLGILNSFNGNIILAITFLMLTGVCDMFDGKIAKTRKRNKQEKRFGIQIDSLSDFLCFGVLPAMIGYNLGMDKYYLIPVIVLYVLTALIRLAYFNVIEEERQDTTEEDRIMCTGLPVPPSAIIFPVVYLVSNIFFKDVVGYVFASIMLLVSVLFISKFEIKKLQMKELIIMILLGIVILSLLVIFGR